MTDSTKPSRSSREPKALKRVVAITAFAVAGGSLAAGVMNFGLYSNCPTKGARTKATMSILGKAISMYREEKGRSPASLQELVPGYIDPSKLLVDGWRREFYYSPESSSPGHPFELRSAGGDGVMSSGDDVDVWSLKQAQELPVKGV